jgi:hypothetical protein
MNKDESTKSEVEGEGSYSATRQYNQHVAESIESGGLEAAADDARRAVEGSERAELERAEAEAKKGPKQKPNAAPVAKPTRPT